MGDYYVYVYLDPRKSGEFIYEDIKFDYEPFYVGKGCGNRIKTSIDDNNNNDLKSNKVFDIRRCGLEPIKLKLYDNLSNTSSYEMERETIRKIGRLINDSGILVNKAKGSHNKIFEKIFKLKYENIYVKIIEDYGDEYKIDTGHIIPKNHFKKLFEEY